MISWVINRISLSPECSHHKCGGCGYGWGNGYGEGSGCYFCCDPIYSCGNWNCYDGYGEGDGSDNTGVGYCNGSGIGDITLWEMG